ncbi:MAG: protein tyrosine phosphatase [Candidatus Paceibacter sp.]|jgi:hypothetical protein|nr:protein tyrosine phosphatase [Candidatus Paceibacter sp.]
MAEPKRHEIIALKNYFLRNKKKVLKALAAALLFFGVAVAFAGLKLFYPFHFVISFCFLLISLRYFVKAFLFDRKKVVKSKIYGAIKHESAKHKKLLVLVFVLCLCSYILWTVIPHSGNPFQGLNNEERQELIENDLQIATVLLDNLELSGNDLIQSPLLQKKSLTAEESQELIEKWNLFLSVAIESEKVTDVHKYFNRINIFFFPRQHSESFIIAYSLYIKKFELFHTLINTIDDNQVVIKQLNEYSPVFDGKNSYDDVLNRFFSSHSLVRRNIGRMYISFLDLLFSDKTLHEGYGVLKAESIKSHSYLVHHVLNTSVLAAKEKRYSLEKGLSDMWFPVQKNVANMMGESYLSSRNDKFITLEQISELKKHLEPGDILVERRNWYASNVGIPGFWVHGALYTGTLEDMNTYFADLFPMGSYQNFEELLEHEHPKLLKKFKSLDKNNFSYSVIEGKSPGIILLALEESAHADYMGAMRPRLDKKDKLEAILRAFGNFGKPYDYNFDFETRDELVCSELIYDAYQSIGAKKGLNFELRMTSGRKIVSPTDMVRKYSEERSNPDRELDFVYFIDGNEELKKAIVKDEEAFAQSWSRQKYSWFQE